MPLPPPKHRCSPQCPVLSCAQPTNQPTNHSWLPLVGQLADACWSMCAALACCRTALKPPGRKHPTPPHSHPRPHGSPTCPLACRHRLAPRPPDHWVPPLPTARPQPAARHPVIRRSSTWRAPRWACPSPCRRCCQVGRGEGRRVGVRVCGGAGGGDWGPQAREADGGSRPEVPPPAAASLC